MSTELTVYLRLMGMSLVFAGKTNLKFDPMMVLQKYSANMMIMTVERSNFSDAVIQTFPKK